MGPGAPRDKLRVRIHNVAAIVKRDRVNEQSPENTSDLMLTLHTKMSRQSGYRGHARKRVIRPQHQHGSQGMDVNRYNGHRGTQNARFRHVRYKTIPFKQRVAKGQQKNQTLPHVGR